MLNSQTLTKRAALATTVAAVLTASIAATVPTAAAAQPVSTTRPVNEVALSIGAGRMVRLDGQMTDLFVADDRIADVQVKSADQIYIFGKSAGETTIYATNKAGRVLYSANVRVGTNIGSVDNLLRTAMPDARIRATPMNGTVLLTGTVAAPVDIEEAQRIVQAFVGQGTQVISRLKTATPLQVSLHVKIAEVSRQLVKEIGFNLLSRDKDGVNGNGFIFGIGQGSPGTITTNVGTEADPKTGTPPGGTIFGINNKTGATSLGFAGRLLGIDLLSTLDLNEGNGRVVTLAEPNLTALSGETASFLAGGEFPILSSSGINGATIEYKEYGVSLASPLWCSRAVASRCGCGRRFRSFRRPERSSSTASTCRD